MDASGVLGFLVDRFRRENLNRQILDVAVDDDSMTAAPIEDGKGYFRLWARRMFLSRERDWFHGQYPTVQSFLTFDFGGETDQVTVAHAAGPDHLASVDENHLNRVIQVNHLLTGLVPFRGGSVKVETAMVATKIDDDLTRFLNVVGDFSKLVSVPQLSLAIDVASKVTDGVKQLAHADGNNLVTGFTGTFVGTNETRSDRDYVLRNSLFLALNAPASDFQRGELRFRDGQVTYHDAPLEGVDWLLLEIETATKRDNIIDSFPSISEPFEKAVDALQRVTNNDTSAADALVRSALVVALNSDDLIETDRRRAVDEIKERYRDRKQALLEPLGVDNGRGETFPGIAESDLAAMLEV